MSYRLRLICIFSLIYLSGCNGSAPILTCRNPCEKSYETRDLFCECRDWRNVDLGKQPTEGPKPEPRFFWSWEEALGCPLNRHYYLINPTPRKYAVTVSWREPGASIDRKSKEYTLGPNITDYRDGIDLGYEELPDPDGKLCFDKDFMVSGYRETKYQTFEESAKAILAERTSDIALMHAIAVSDIQSIRLASKDSTPIPPPPITRFGPAAFKLHADLGPTIEIHKQITLDCQAVCNAGDTVRCPIRGFPPDQDKIKAIRDKIRANIGKQEYSSADIYNIFGLTKAACNREDIRGTATKLFNTGKYCAYPMFLKDTDTKPGISIHFPESVKGQKIDSKVNSGIAFNDGVSQPALIFSDYGLHNDFGGKITEASASDKGVYYQTVNTCIFIGIRQ